MADVDKQIRDAELDQVLDAILAKYAATEPRAGLEERILANLRGADVRIEHGGSWSWRIAVALAGVLMVATAVVWQWSRASHSRIANHPSSTQQKMAPIEMASQDENCAPVKHGKRAAVRRPPRHEMLAPDPKLDVFPSPLPLSEQEKILASYVREYPEHAALVAEARMDALRQQDQERRRMAGQQDEKQ